MNLRLKSGILTSEEKGCLHIRPGLGCPSGSPLLTGQGPDFSPGGGPVPQPPPCAASGMYLTSRTAVFSLIKQWLHPPHQGLGEKTYAAYSRAGHMAVS